MCCRGQARKLNVVDCRRYRKTWEVGIGVVELDCPRLEVGAKLLVVIVPKTSKFGFCSYQYFIAFGISFEADEGKRQHERLFVPRVNPPNKRVPA